MNNQERLFNYKDGLFLRGIGMLAFGLAALWYPGAQIETMITPFGILVLMNGLATILVGRFFFSSGSVLRVLSVRHGLLDLFVGSGALTAGMLGLAVFPMILAIWLLATGIFYCFFSLRFIPVSTHLQLIRLGAAYILLGGWYCINHLLNIWEVVHPVPVMAISLGAYTYYILYQIRRTERNEMDIPPQSFPPDPFDSTKMYHSAQR